MTVEVEDFEGYDDEDEYHVRWDGVEICRVFGVRPVAYAEKAREDGLVEVEVLYALALEYETGSPSRGSYRKNRYGY